MTDKENKIFETILREHVVTSELRDVYRRKMKEANQTHVALVKPILEAGIDNKTFKGRGKKK